MTANEPAPTISRGRLRKRFTSFLKRGRTAFVAGAVIIGAATSGVGVTEVIDATTGSASNSTIITGQVACPSYGKQAIGVTGMQFRMSDGQIVSAALSPITDSTGSRTSWDHYSADIPASAGTGYAYDARVTCGRQENWTPRVTGTDSRTIICGVADGECSDTVANPPSVRLSQAHPPYQKGFQGESHPEPPHTPDP